MTLLDDLFKLLGAVNDDMCKFNQSLEEEWFTNIDEKVYSFKRKIHKWVKESETDGRTPIGSVMSSRKKSSRSSSSSKHSTEDRFMEENLKVAKFLADQPFK